MGGRKSRWIEGPVRRRSSAKLVLGAALAVSCGRDFAPGPSVTADVLADSGVPGWREAGVGLAADDAVFAAKRAACTFKAGAKASDTFGPSLAERSIPIDTIVIVSQEN